MTKPKMIAHLVTKGWKVVRKRGEPLFFRDPFGFEIYGLRVETAYALQAKRDESFAKRDRISR